MKQSITIALLAIVTAAAIGTFSVSGLSASTLVTASTQSTNDAIPLLGHIEYVVRGSDGDIKAYYQTDNVVTETGTDCTSRKMFASGTSVGLCTSSPGDFNFIAVGNQTSPAAVSATNTRLQGAGDGLAYNGGDATHLGEMARKSVTPSFNVAGTNTIVTLSNSASPFSFTTTNATTVTQSGIFSANGSPNVHCETTALNGFMWAIQNIPSGGVVVGNGDSLTVTWTVTVG